MSMEKSVRGRRMPPVIGKNKFSPQKNQMIRQNYTAMCENIDRRNGNWRHFHLYAGRRTSAGTYPA
ncbi:MAG: hypothetical protein ACYCSP_15770 [Acidobacteriaceae bacterium]